MSTFCLFQQAVAKQFERMQTQGTLFRTGVSKDALWEHYLASFPSGTNPLFRTRTEHDCGCCRQFVRSIGNVVAIIDGEIETIWQGSVFDLPDHYVIVADALSELVLSHPIVEPFFHHEHKIGQAASHEKAEGQPVHQWDHFAIEIAKSNSRGYIEPKDKIPTLISQAQGDVQVASRGLRELTFEAIDEVLELIEQGTLYRGAEHEAVLKAFRDLKVAWIETDKSEAFLWLNYSAFGARIRNSAIGTLLIDLSEGIDTESAVAKFTAMVAPQNYQRPTAQVTEGMVKKARQAVQGLGLESALHRRQAVLSDLSIRDILFVDHSARAALRADAFSGLPTRQTSRTPSGAGMPIETFIEQILPQASTIEVLFDPTFGPNLVSLIGPTEQAPRRLFKWANPFSWSYNGEVADSIRERVKRAGGNVEGELCCRLAWSNTDDLDLHMVESGGGHIYFNSKVSSLTGGRLDVDMNVGTHGRPLVRDPVENIFYSKLSSMRPGQYELVVHQYARRESRDVGFEVQIQHKGEILRLAYPKALPQGHQVIVAIFKFKDGNLHIEPKIDVTTLPQDLWGLRTGDWARCNLLLRSPNHWADEQPSGNRHYFFMLDGARAPAGRPFFNEFLHADLHPHRKVFELLGARTQVEVRPAGLAGLGFSDTKRAEIQVKVDNKPLLLSV